MGLSPESYTFITMGRRHKADSQAKLGVMGGEWLVVSVRTVRRETFYSPHKARFLKAYPKVEIIRDRGGE